MKQEIILSNRIAFLKELRSGKYKKGTIKSNEKGYPVFETNSDREGHCACAVMGEMFGKTNTGKISLSQAMKAIGVDSKACRYIQKYLNDTPLTFSEIADRIQVNVFENNGGGMAALLSQAEGIIPTKKEREGIAKIVQDFKVSGEVIHI